MRSTDLSMRYINQIFAPPIGERWDNQTLLGRFEPLVERLPLPDEARGKLRELVRFQLVGERSRHSLTPDWAELASFESRAGAFQRGADLALDALAEQIAPAAENAGVT